MTLLMCVATGASGLKKYVWTAAN